MGIKIRIVINLAGMEYISKDGYEDSIKTAVNGQIRGELMNDVRSSEFPRCPFQLSSALTRRIKYLLIKNK